MTGKADERQSYFLATGEQSVSRLDLLDRIFGPGTRDLLKTAGLAAGMRVAEIGCGAGQTAQWIAARVGPHGSVVAVDASGDQLQVAKASAKKAGIKNLSLHETHAYDLGLPEESFHLVYSRFLFCHLDDPARALREMKSILKPGGVLVCEDHDDGGIFTEPQTHAYRRLVEISDAVNRARGLDSYIGVKLPRLFRAAGFSRLNVRVNQLAFLRGEEKRFWEITLREAAPAILSAGASTPDELVSICQEMQTIATDENILLMLARVTQVWAQS
ncbi:MAG TPA: methyltransferase domain-containing protein [Terriglobales bacterium]|nr:methyltransferase domain-containing protein [Terriglobales bacterium]